MTSEGNFLRSGSAAILSLIIVFGSRVNEKVTKLTNVVKTQLLNQIQ